MVHVARRFSAAVLAAAILVAGCQEEKKTKPDYNRPLPPGANALRLLQEREWPDVKPGFSGKDADLMAALDRSVAWFNNPSAEKFFPMFDVGLTRARTSAYAFRQILRESNSPAEFEQKLKAEFNCYTTVGFDDKGGVLFTGYYTPIFKGSLTPDSTFKYPLYKRPKDLVTDPLSGEPKGRQVGGSVQPWPTRKEIEESGMFKGTELVYVADKFEAYIIHVNGSAKIELPDGKFITIGYAGKTDRPYKGIGKTLVAEGKIEPEKLSLMSLKAYFKAHPEDLDKYINANESYVFFSEYPGENWPAGSIGVKVTDFRSIATDKTVFPRAGVVYVNTTIPTPAGSKKPFNQFVLDQDTGGAIRAAGRADIYMGIGPNAERLAGGEFAEGRMYYFFLKHEKVLDWNSRVNEDPSMQKKKPAAKAKPKIG
jgi:membrane-bound lytic murein transglycosylase A